MKPSEIEMTARIIQLEHKVKELTARLDRFEQGQEQRERRVLEEAQRHAHMLQHYAQGGR